MFNKDKKDSMCILPWNHVHTNTDGIIGPCCISNHGVYRRDSLSISNYSVLEATNSKFMKQLRVDMMNGIENPACETCYYQESLGNQSVRTGKNNAFKLKEQRDKLLKNTKKDGELKSLKDIQYLDIRFSNLCNFKCIMCSHMFSSAWHEDAKKLHSNNWYLYEENNPKVITAGTDDDLWSKIEPLLHGPIEFIYFAGGEPLITENHYRILERLIELEKYPDLWYTTNFSIIEYKQYNILDMWNKLSEGGSCITVNASIDGSHKRGEYIRHGLSWDKFIENKKAFDEKCPDINFDITTVWGNTNSLHITDFFKEMLELKIVDIPNRLTFNDVGGVDFLSITTLPIEYKRKVENNISELKEWVESNFNFDDYFEFFKKLDNYIIYMNNKDESSQLPLYFENMKRLDKVRNQNLFNVFPELINLKKYETV